MGLGVFFFFFKLLYIYGGILVFLPLNGSGSGQIWIKSEPDPAL